MDAELAAMSAARETRITHHLAACACENDVKNCRAARAGRACDQSRVALQHRLPPAQQPYLLKCSGQKRKLYRIDVPDAIPAPAQIRRLNESEDERGESAHSTEPPTRSHSPLSTPVDAGADSPLSTPVDAGAFQNPSAPHVVAATSSLLAKPGHECQPTAAWRRTVDCRADSPIRAISPTIIDPVHPSQSAMLELPRFTLRGAYFHAMISYRVATEGGGQIGNNLSNKLYEKTRDLSLEVDDCKILSCAWGTWPRFARKPKPFVQHQAKVYLDKECLLDGQGWELGFIKGLSSSMVMVCLLSCTENDRGSIGDMMRLNPPQEDWIDNVLLELIVGLELRKLDGRSALCAIMPVLIGPLTDSGRFEPFPFSKLSKLSDRPSEKTNARCQISLKLSLLLEAVLKTLCYFLSLSSSLLLSLSLCPCVCLRLCLCLCLSLQLWLKVCVSYPLPLFHISSSSLPPSFPFPSPSLFLSASLMGVGRLKFCEAFLFLKSKLRP